MSKEGLSQSKSAEVLEFWQQQQADPSSVHSPERIKTEIDLWKRLLGLAGVPLEQLGQVGL